MKRLIIFIPFVISVLLVVWLVSAINAQPEEAPVNSEPEVELIRVNSPSDGAEISSPVEITGQARGYWFFEASFPIQVINNEGDLLGIGFAEAKDEWMTEDFVPFRAEFDFRTKGAEEGVIVLMRDNPSGLPEYDDEIRVPVEFSDSAGGCIVTGCSGQVCSAKEVITTCEFTPGYACYKDAICERQETGECDWTSTEEFTACLDDITKN